MKSIAVISLICLVAATDSSIEDGPRPDTDSLLGDLLMDHWHSGIGIPTNAGDLDAIISGMRAQYIDAVDSGIGSIPKQWSIDGPRPDKIDDWLGQVSTNFDNSGVEIPKNADGKTVETVDLFNKLFGDFTAPISNMISEKGRSGSVAGLSNSAVNDGDTIGGPKPDSDSNLRDLLMDHRHSGIRIPTDADETVDAVGGVVNNAQKKFIPEIDDGYWSGDDWRKRKRSALLAELGQRGSGLLSITGANDDGLE